MSGAGNFLISEPIKWKIKDGRVLEITGGREAQRLKELVHMKDGNAVNIGEFAFGTNHVIKDPRGDHADKVIIGGMHLALGTTLGYGSELGAGGVKTEMHCDGVSLGITIVAEGQTVLKDGKFQI
jgi:leucyl aminopeptidase (aminopeptidase T)